MSERAATAATVQTQAVAEASTLHRRCACGSHSIGGAECTNCRNARVAASRRGHGRPHHPVAPAIVHDALRAPGQSLDAQTRAFMESRFERDFSAVRVHTDAQAAASARAVRAHAYTVGDDIVFASGRYRPETTHGRHLLAHELAHVAQASALPKPGEALTISEPTDASERAADRAADAAMVDRSAAIAPANSGAALHRDAEEAGAGTTTSPAPANEDPEYGPYNGCGTYRQKVEADRAEAARLAGHAASVLDAADLAPAAQLLSDHFHIDIARPGSRALVPQIRGQFARMQSGLNSSITIICRTAPSPSPGVLPTMPVDPGCRGDGRHSALASSNNCADNDPRSRSKLCEMALLEMHLPLKQTLLHEFAHIACNGNPQITGVGAEVYYPDGRRLPGDQPDQITQADSYAWFALQAERIGAAPAGGDDSGPGAGWVAMAVLGGAAMVAGGIGLGVGLSDSDSGNDGLAAGLGIGGLVAGGALLGVGIAGSAGAFDRRPAARTGAAETGRTSTASPASATPTLAQLATMPMWQLAQLPESAFAATTTGTTTATPPGATTSTSTPATPQATAPAAGARADAGPTMQDYARAWRMVRCIRDFHGLGIDPETTGQLGRAPNAAESAVLGRSLSRILGHANVAALVRGPGGRSDQGGNEALANRVRIVDPLHWGVKRFQLETMISGIGAGADALVRQWWAEARCGIGAAASPRIVDQERRMAVLHEHIMAGRLGEGGFYLPPDDTIYLSESAARNMIGTGAESRSMAATAGHEMVHMLGGREQTRQAFVRYFPGDRWICYWSAFEEGMAELTTRDAFGDDAGGSRMYGANVDLMRGIMRTLGEERVRRAYFTGTPDSAIFEALRAELPNHLDPGLPPICHTPETTP